MKKASLKVFTVNGREVNFNENYFAKKYLDENDICQFEVIVPNCGEIENFQEKYLYKGFFRRGIPHGKGFKVEPVNKIIVWEGEFSDGKEFTGRGKCSMQDQFGNAYEYDGELLKGRPNKKGTKIDMRTKEIIWEGDFKDGREYNGSKSFFYLFHFIFIYYIK